MFCKVVVLRRLPLSLAYFDYNVPPELETTISPGQLVRVPFQKYLAYGLVRSLGELPHSRSAPLKTVNEIVVAAPLVTPTSFIFLEEIAARYRAPLGWLCAQALPPLQIRKLKSAAWVKPLPSAQAALPLPASRPRLVCWQRQSEKRVYLNKHIPRRGQVLIVVPGLIDLDPLLKLLPAAWQKQTALISSKLSKRDYFKAWQAVYTGSKRIVIGTRLAFWLPWFNLTHIFLDDESNALHKNPDMAPRTHNRDVAELLASLAPAELHLFSQTPSVETFWAAEQHIYQTNRRGAVPPVVAPLINLADERKAGHQQLLSGLAEAKLRRHTTGASFLYLNRRGTGQYVTCRGCAWVYACPRCQTSLTYFESKGVLVCRHCNLTKEFSLRCPRCGHLGQTARGGGTELLLSQVRAQLSPERRIFKIEAGNGSATLPPLKAGDVIIGTRYAWDIINWEKITFMVFVDADLALFVPEWRSPEELWQQIHVAASRLGKAPYVQTAYPDHPLFQALRQPEKFYQAELAMRQNWQYPPFCLLARCYRGFATRAKAEQDSARLLQDLKKLTAGRPAVTITGPIPMFPEYARGAYWRTFVLKITGPKRWETLKQTLAAVPDGWKVDPSPHTLLSL